MMLKHFSYIFILYTQISTHIIIYINNIITKNNANNQYLTPTYIIIYNKKLRLQLQTLIRNNIFKNKLKC